MQKFGYKLYETFFKVYTEKVWGVPCDQIDSEWAAQRIRGLNVLEVLKRAVYPPSNRVRSLAGEFRYPSLGAGQMYDAMAERACSQGVRLHLSREVVRVHRKGTDVEYVEYLDPSQCPCRVYAAHFFSSIPVTRFIDLLDPKEPSEILTAARALYYRDHVTVNLLVDGGEIFPDHWIYVHSPEVKMARLASYGNFSKAMVAHQNKTALSAEYFAFRGDDVWRLSDDEIIEMTLVELNSLKLFDTKRIEGAWVLRQTEAYPTYYVGFRQPREILKHRLMRFTNVTTMGRGGLYKYDNQDHSAYSGLLAVRNYLRPSRTPFDLWRTNEEAEYHEKYASA